MHKLLAIPFFLFILSFPPADKGVSVTITSLRNSRGYVLVSLYKDGTGFPGDPGKAVRKAKLTIKENKAWVIFTGLPSGKYAVAILHDENNDQKMNKNFLGLPKEGYGFSNNAMGTFGPPSFSRAAFNYNSTGAQVPVLIEARY